MAIFDVSIKGKSPLIQHRYPEETEPEKKSRKKTAIPSAKDECETALYKDEKGRICQPSVHIKSAMVKAAVAFKAEGKKTCKDLAKYALIVSPRMVPHKNPKWEIFRTNVVIQRARIMRARPLFKEWVLDFQIETTEDRLAPETVKDILVEAGQHVGIGDWRPEYGRFEVVKFTPKK